MVTRLLILVLAAISMASALSGVPKEWQSNAYIYVGPADNVPENVCYQTNPTSMSNISQKINNCNVLTGYPQGSYEYHWNEDGNEICAGFRGSLVNQEFHESQMCTGTVFANSTMPLGPNCGKCTNVVKSSCRVKCEGMMINNMDFAANYCKDPADVCIKGFMWTLV